MGTDHRIGGREMLTGKNIVLGVTGGIAAYKAVDLVSRLRKQNANVYVVMTEHAKAFVTPLTFQSMSQNYVVHDMFEEPKTWDVEHIALAKKADVFIVAPASANVIGKVASGIADDFLTTTLMATQAQVIFAPAMNTNMYCNPIVQHNIETLKTFGYQFIEPGSGRLACGDVGAGKMAEPEVILNYISEYFSNTTTITQSSSSMVEQTDGFALSESEDRLKGMRILVTAGPTVERIDPVRFMTNRSSGKMGYAIAAKAVEWGANVTLVSGPTQLKPPAGVTFVQVESAQDMYEAVMAAESKQDAFIKTAAVADYRPLQTANQKIKKQEGDLTLTLTRNPDILMELGKRKGNRVLVGFAAETNNVLEYAKGKIEKKNLDFIVANDVSASDAGFGTDQNRVTLIDASFNETHYDLMPKDQVAEVILSQVLNLFIKRQHNN